MREESTDTELRRLVASARPRIHVLTPARARRLRP
jgi:hypothetical protein